MPIRIAPPCLPPKRGCGELGLSMRSGCCGAPTRGGQSWLSHATFANGLWIDNQTSYGAVLASGRETLFHIAPKPGSHRGSDAADHAGLARIRGDGLRHGAGRARPRATPGLPSTG
jgi:hypothetical protein